MYAKKNARVTFRSNRRQSFKRSNSFSNGKGRNKGNISQQYQKYLKLAKEASSSGDRIQAEYYYQFADHYSRLMIELGVFIDENSENQNLLEGKNIIQKSANDDKSDEEVESNKEEVAVEAEDDNDPSSIESVPFISQPAKKKSVKTKKQSA